MKILHVCNDYLFTKLYSALIEGLEKEGVNNFVFMSTWKKELKSSKDNVLVKKCYNFLDRFFFSIKEKKVIKAVKENANIFEYDLLHAHNLFSDGYAAYKISLQTGKPYIVAVRNTDVNHFYKKRFWLRRKGNKVLRDAKSIIFLSPAYRDFLIEKYVPKKWRTLIRDKAVVIPNGIDEFWHVNALLDGVKELDEKTIRIICVGQVCKNKNFLTTLSACEILKSKGYEVSFGVVGETLDKNILNKLLEKEYVTYYGKKSKEDIFEIYKKYDIFVMPSFTETFGLVYAEAMSQGLPVIYSKGQGFDRQFRDGEIGFCVEPNSAEDVAEKIVQVVNKYEELSRNCCSMHQKFKWSGVAKRYVNIYNDMLKMQNVVKEL